MGYASVAKKFQGVRNKMNKYYQNNKEKVKRQVRNWRIKNLEKYRQLNRAQHEKRMFNGKKQIVLERDNFTCQSCGMNNQQHIVIFGYGLIVHHIDGNGKNSEIPNNNINNLLTLCHTCHTSHHSKQLMGNKNPNHRNFRGKK